jgi:hypothetical protein
MMRFPLIVLFLSFTTLAHAQSGTLRYGITVDVSDPEMQMVKALLMNSEMEIFYSPTYTAITMRLGMMSTTKTISDLKSKKSLTIVESMMGNFFAKSITDDKVELDPATDMQVQLVNETRIISGLECKKALITDTEGNDYTIWYAPKLNFPVLNRFDIGKNAKIPGAMVEFELMQAGFSMKFTLLSYSDKVDDPNAFNMTVPEGYTEMSPEVLQSFGF